MIYSAIYSHCIHPYEVVGFHRPLWIELLLTYRARCVHKVGFGWDMNVALFRRLPLRPIFACTTTWRTVSLGTYYRIVLLAESDPFLDCE